MTSYPKNLKREYKNAVLLGCVWTSVTINLTQTNRLLYKLDVTYELMIITNQKPIIDTQQIERKESNHNTRKCH